MPIDLIFIAVFGYGFWQGYTRGIISTVFNILAYVFGIVLSFKMTPVTTSILERLFNSDNPSMFLAAFVVNLVFIMFILRQTARGMEGVLQTLYLGVFNKVAGGLLVGAVSILIYSVLIWFLVKVQFLNQTTLEQSRSYPLLKELPLKSKDFAMRFEPFAKDVWGTSMNWMNRLENYGEKKTGVEKPKIYELPDDGKGIELDEPASGSPSTKKPVKTSDNDGIEK